MLCVSLVVLRCEDTVSVELRYINKIYYYCYYYYYYYYFYVDDVKKMWYFDPLEH